jgi:hypothetical protein
VAVSFTYKSSLYGNFRNQASGEDDKDFSLTDCTCFVLMQENGIRAAFTFDDDYKIYIYRQGRQKMGFWKLPEMLDSYATGVFV